MREILFQGKRKDNGDWIEGYVYRISEELNPFIMLKNRHGESHEVDPETVRQFTGLADKKGKRIFEGDKCRVSRPCVLAYGKIAFLNGCFWFVDDGPGGMLRLCDVKMNGFEIEVIGNIHDNPELQEG